MGEKNNLKKISTVELAEAMSGLLNEGYDVQVLVSGSSMLPFLASCRDSVTVSPVSGELRRGDIVFYRRITGTVVMHRIIGIDRKGLLTVCGDAQLEKEYPIMPSQVFGTVTKAQRKGKSITHRNALWWFFRCPWRWLRPVRHKIMKAYIYIFKKKKQEDCDAKQPF